MIEVVIWTVVSFFAARDKKPALLIMGTYLLFSITAVISGLFIIPPEQYLLKSTSIITGGYFVFGGYVLIQHARKLPSGLNKNKTV